MGKEIVFYIDIKNVSTIPQTVFVVRTINNLSPNWSSSLCLEFCYPPTIDSIATTPDFGSTPLQPNEVREVSLHVYTSATVPGQGYLQLKAGTFRNPNQTIVVNFIANTFNPSSVRDESLVKNFYLEQNYPNPFGNVTQSNNLSTTISWTSPYESWQSIKLFNILGQEIETITEGIYQTGKHSLSYKINSALPAGIYLYQLRIDNHIETKKMILEK
jgi:hypothetical protein